MTLTGRKARPRNTSDGTAAIFHWPTHLNPRNRPLLCTETTVTATTTHKRARVAKPATQAFYRVVVVP